MIVPNNIILAFVLFNSSTTCGETPSALESTRAIASVFVRTKAKRLKAWTCEA